MKKIKCTLCAIVFLSLLPVTSNAQIQFGMKLGRVYLINTDYYKLNTGYSASTYAYPFRKDNFSLGVEVGYISKGYIDEYIFFGESKPVEYLSVGIPIRYDIKSQGVFDFFILAAGRYDMLLQNNFQQTVSDGDRWNSNFVYSIGAGILYKKLNPHFTFDISYSRDAGEFVTDKVTNSFLDLKLGILFDGL